MSSKFEQMRRRENRRIRANFEKTKSAIMKINSTGADAQAVNGL